MGHSAGLAVDGNTNPDVGAGHCAHMSAGAGNSSQWLVDLKEDHVTNEVTIFNRAGGASRRMTLLQVCVGNTLEFYSPDHVLCGVYPGTVEPSAKNTIKCNKPVTGQYVIIRNGDGVPEGDLMSLCEVAVVGYKPYSCANCSECDLLTGCKSCTAKRKLPDCQLCEDGFYGGDCEFQCHCSKGGCNENGCKSGCKLCQLVNFSAEKTKLMTRSFQSIDHPDVIFDDVVLPETKTHKHLGLTLSSNLSWSSHIDSILNSVAPMADVLKKLKYQVDKESLEKIYFSFIRPKLEYGNYILGQLL